MAAGRIEIVGYGLSVVPNLDDCVTVLLTCLDGDRAAISVRKPMPHRIRNQFVDEESEDRRLFRGNPYFARLDVERDGETWRGKGAERFIGGMSGNDVERGPPKPT